MSNVAKMEFIINWLVKRAMFDQEQCTAYAMSRYVNHPKYSGLSSRDVINALSRTAETMILICHAASTGGTPFKINYKLRR